MGSNYIEDYLYARPSAIEGIARIFDLASNLQKYNTSQTTNEADIKAISNDWRAVGADLLKAIEEYEKNNSKF